VSALIWCPFPDEDSAAAVATRLLDEKLIACANLLGRIRSLYEWNGERGDGQECGALFKTHADMLDAAVARVAELHPYEAPAVLGWRCDAAGAATAEWLAGLAGPN
jgi:periplasmic divalent cation tolerance protein